MHRSPARLFLYSLAMVMLALLAGCSSATMSATPFTGDSTNSRVAPDVANASSPEEIERERIREELSGDRVMLWPAYYRTRRESGLTQTIFWPLAVWHRAKDDFDAAVFPLFARRRSAERSMLMTPLGGFRDNFEKNKGWSSILWPVWFRTWDGEERSWHFLFPITQFERGEDSYNNMVFPLFMQGKSADGHLLYTLLYSTDVDRAEDKRLTRIGTLLYSRERTKQDIMQSFLLLFRRDKKVDEQGREQKGVVAFPLYYQKKEFDGGRRQFFLPLLYLNTSFPEQAFRDEFDKFLTEHPLTPIAEDYAFPFHKTVELKQPISSRSAFLNLYSRSETLKLSREQTNTTTTITSSRRKKSWLVPVYYSSIDPEKGNVLFAPLAGLFMHKTRPRAEAEATATRLALADGPQFSCGLSGFNTPAVISESQAFLCLFQTNKDIRGTVDRSGPTPTVSLHERRRTSLFPFYYHRNEETVGKRTRLLLGLYSGDTYEKAGEPTASRARFLYKLYHRVQEGDRVRGEAFPFVGWETTEDVKRWGFLGGFIGHATDAKESRTRIFWIPIRSRRAS